MVAAPHALATEAGRAVFAAGGNAVDAAIAAAATIAVVYPHMNSIGGDNFWLIYDARARRLRALNACGRSAAQVDADAYRTRYGEAMPVRGGAAAIMVPGVVSGWWDAHRMSREALGSPIPWKRLLEDAMRHAGDGFAVSPGQRRVTADASALFGATAPIEIRRSFWPVYHPDRFADGRFVRDPVRAAAAAEAREIRREVEAQIERFERLVGRRPTHLDSHHHVGLYPPVRDVVLVHDTAAGFKAVAESDACIGRVTNLANLSSGLRIRDQEQLVPIQFTPTTGVTISEFDEKDGAVKFVLPGSWLDFFLPLIDLDE